MKTWVKFVDTGLQLGLTEWFPVVKEMYVRQTTHGDDGKALGFLFMTVRPSSPPL